MKSTSSACRLALLFAVAPLAMLALPGLGVAQREGGSEPPEVIRPVKMDVSPPLRSITPLRSTKAKKAEDDQGPRALGIERHDADPNAQTEMGTGVFSRPAGIPGTGANFNGMTNPFTINPPDPVGDIGPNHYVQMVNLRFQIFSRSGVSLFGPANINTLFAGFGGPCETENAGDPVVMYDQLADRWFLSQFSDSLGPPFLNCIAISQTPDPMAPWIRYAFDAPTFPDYPKYAIWPDAYYLNTRESGILGLYALDRTAMLAGGFALGIKFTVSQTASGPSAGPNGLLNADLEGTTLPPPGSPNYLVGTKDNDFGASADALMFFRFKPDFVTPANSTFLGPINIPIAPFDTNFPCNPAGTRNCIQQPGTATRIDILSYRQRPTWRLSYRNFGTHESLVTSQSVEGAPAIAGMRWWEIRNPGPSPVLFQEGTYAPGATDGIHRWMGSIAMDKQGNMALGYSVSDATSVFPGIRYTGRLVSDPPGTMPQGEGIIVNGGGAQGSTGNRWGDYSSMNVDPIDDCTFWYTNEYYATSSSTGWSTRIASFKFPECDAPTAVRAPADFDLDGKSDIVVFRPSNGTWFVLKSQTGTSESLAFGQNGDVPLDADFDGDRKADYAVWRQGTGEWFFRRSTDGTFGGALWGVNGDKPVTGDYDADGKTDLAVWRPSDGLNYIVRSTGGFLGVQWGGGSDIPANVDINADGKTDFAVFRPSNGTWFTLINGTTTNEAFAFGQNGDIPLRGDFDGDQKGDIAVWRPTTGEWFFRRSSNGTFGGLQWGANGDKPVPGDFDGDGRTDFGVFRASNGTHYIVRNSGGFIGFAWGAPGDLAILGSPLP